MGQCISVSPVPTAKSLGLPSDRFHIKKNIGSGAEGQLYLARDKVRKKGDNWVAIKLIKRGPQVDEKRLLREVKLQSTLTHLHIIKIYQIILTESHFVIVMEYAPGGDLFNFLTKSVKPLNDEQVMTEVFARYLFRQIICAVKYCHERKIAHRDLKLANVLLDGNNPPRVKLCDFGLCNTYEYDLINSFTVVGTPAYMSPELLDCHHKEGYNPVEADVWSAGVLLYTMLRGRFPFHSDDGSNLNTVLYNINQAHKGDPSHLWAPAWGKANLSEEVKDLVDRCLEMDPVKRITVEQIVDHPWFNVEPGEPWSRVQDMNERAQKNWNKVIAKLTPDQEQKLSKLIYEAGIAHGHPGEILEWMPPNSIRIRTEASYPDLSEEEVTRGLP